MGSAEGRTVGSSVGKEEGVGVGWTVGCGEGDGLGFFVGLNVTMLAEEPAIANSPEQRELPRQPSRTMYCCVAVPGGGVNCT